MPMVFNPTTHPSKRAGFLDYESDQIYRNNQTAKPLYLTSSSKQTPSRNTKSPLTKTFQVTKERSQARRKREEWE